MLLSRSARKPEPEDLVSLLLACHARIRSFAGWAASLGPGEALSEAQVKDTAERCARYFHEAFPLHVRDEEESVMPRLLALSEETAIALGSMEQEHAEHGPEVRVMVALLRATACAPSDMALRARLHALATPLAEALEAHLAMEEAQIFPAIALHLTRDAQAEAVRELRARRHAST